MTPAPQFAPLIWTKRGVLEGRAQRVDAVAAGENAKVDQGSAIGIGDNSLPASRKDAMARPWSGRSLRRGCLEKRDPVLLGLRHSSPETAV